MIDEHETYLAREDAKLLAELGFDWGNSRNSIFYPKDGFEGCPDGVWAPRVGLALTWLFNNYNAVVTIEPWIHDLDKKNVQYTFKYVVRLNDTSYATYIDSRYEYTHPDEALDAGAKRCIKLLVERNAQSTQER